MVVLTVLFHAETRS